MLPETVASYEYLCKSSAMNITLLINRDLASHIALSRLLNLLSEHRLSIFISEKVGPDHSLPQPLMDLAAHEKQLISSSHSFDSLASQANCQLQGFADLGGQVNGQEAVARIQATEPDVILSIRFGMILREPVIAIPRYGVINLHSGVLPDYRGVMASFWAMVNGESQVGSTLHFIQDSGVDSGDILSIAKIPLNREQSYLLNVLNLYDAGCQQLAHAVQQLDAGADLSAQPQQGQAKYYSFPGDEQLAEFAALGYQLFDTAEIEQIRALQG